MAILNFPDNPQTDDQYTGDNGTTYVFDGVKWVGRPVGGAAGTNSIQNGIYTVQVDIAGNLILPVGSVIKDTNGDPVGVGGLGSVIKTIDGTINAATPSVVWSGNTNSITSAKLNIQVEGNEIGDNTGWHTQSCEAIISSRWYGNGGNTDPQITVYGIIHTSAEPLATFSVQRNPTTKLIEVVGTLTITADQIAYTKIYSVEMNTND